MWLLEATDSTLEKSLGGGMCYLILGLGSSIVVMTSVDTEEAPVSHSDALGVAKVLR